MNPYKQTLIYNTERILSLLSRNPLSSTYGCFDRNFWHFKTIIDFPSATYQQVVVGLSRLYTTRTNDNIFYAQPLLAEAVHSGVLYWCKIQNRDGSQNEYYENDRSFCPTAFTTYAIADAFVQARQLFTPAEADLILSKLKRGANWLSTQSFSIVQNQMMASMNALFRVAQVTGDAKIMEEFKKRRGLVLDSQNQEGWFPEYRGADTGYSFKQLYLLSSYLEAAERDGEILAAAGKLIEFIVHFLHPDGTCGGEYNSRSTQHVMSYAIDYFQRKLNTPATQQLSAWFHRHLAEGNMLTSASIDDKYASYFYFNSDVQAFLSYVPAQIPESRPQFPRVKQFAASGLMRLSVDDVTAFLSYRRNGVIRVYKGSRLVYSDCGYVLKANKELCATQCEDRNAIAKITDDQSTVSITTEGVAGKVDDSLPLVSWMVPFKIVCKTILRFDWLGYWFNNKLKADRVARQYQIPVRMTRSIEISATKFKIKDVVECTNRNGSLQEVKKLRDVTTVHSPSSRFYQHQYLLLEPEVKEVKDAQRYSCELEIAL